MNGDGASCSREVDLPDPRLPVPCPNCYAMADELARYRRLLQDAEHRTGLGYWASSVVDPFGSEPAKELAAALSPEPDIKETP